MPACVSSLRSSLLERCKREANVTNTCFRFARGGHEAGRCSAKSIERAGPSAHRVGERSRRHSSADLPSHHRAELVHGRPNDAESACSCRIFDSPLICHVNALICISEAGREPDHTVTSRSGAQWRDHDVRAYPSASTSSPVLTRTDSMASMSKAFRWAKLIDRFLRRTHAGAYLKAE